jgi:SAM-dependent methyltransferase
MTLLSNIVVDEGIPLPPPRLRYKVAGTEDPDWFTHSGRMSLADLSRALAVIGRSIEEFSDVLEWGCGCGRILRHLPPPPPHRRIYGFDIDQEAISWVSVNLPWVETSRTEGLPPLPYADASFDLIFNHSVMSHLDASYQDAWLGELRRTLRPGGIATLSVHGRHAFQMFLDTFPPESLARTTHAANLHGRGIVFIVTDQWTGDFPDFYHTSYNDVSYIFNHWARFLDVCCYIPRGALNYQDLIVLQRTAEDGNGSRTYQDYVSRRRLFDDGSLALSAQAFSDISRRRKLHLAWRLLREGLGLKREKK